MNEDRFPEQQSLDDSTMTQQRSVRDTADDVDMRRASDVRDVRERNGDVRETEGFLPEDRMSSFRDRWSDVQAGFVDDPRSAVERAQKLVDDLVKELTDVFSRERSTLEGRWSSGSEADTEALRVALQRYRDFFNRLLST